jgi:hypothetical protein
LQGYAEMERNQVEQYGVTFYRPAWEFAGLFMHGICGLFLDERDNNMGYSTANFALAQMKYAQEQNYSVWGWSACNLPNDTEDYTVDGHLSQAVITPHASALVISYYPRKVVENLRRLEALGCRPPFRENGKNYAFGFRDSINLVTGEVSELYYAGLDQAMLLLALANYLEDGYIWKMFSQDPVVKKGLRLVEPVTQKNPQWLSLYTQRDQAAWPASNTLEKKPAADCLVDTGAILGKNSLGLLPRLAMENLASDQASYTLASAAKNASAIRITYNLNSSPQARVGLIEPLGKLDARNFNAVAFKCRADIPEKTATSFRLRITDSYGSNTTGFVEGIEREWQHVVFPLASLKGLLAGCNELQTLEFWLDRAPQYMSNRPINCLQSSLDLADIRFVQLSPEALKKAVFGIKNKNTIRLLPKVPAEGIMEINGWQKYTDQNSSFTLELQPAPQPSLKVQYQIGNPGHWVAWEKACCADLAQDFVFAFEFKASGSPNTLETKFISTEGGVFGKKIEFTPHPGKWQKIQMNRSELQRWWGGQENDTLGAIKSMGWAVSGKSETSGEVVIRDVKIDFQEK